ncbi:GtrA family protein [Aerococcus sp. HMSC10H05]|uniref:GtrA family protein n=1 Tax=Aerococcus sp. HMSC10H05 TaxID=1581084 RepID=UPI0008A35850|nr:GtrA family protein [Aerococcus sp. HMSC10H05]OFU50727.1 sugar translocase [Aerococcus sp. HMSC10H05]
MRNLISQIIKFGLVGIIATVLDFLVLTVLTEFLGIHYLLSAAIAFTVATVFNYIASMKYVFASRYGKGQKHQELFIFVVLSLIGLGLNQVFMWFVVEITVLHYIIAKVLATLLVMAWNFISRKIWLEK